MILYVVLPVILIGGILGGFYKLKKKSVTITLEDQEIVILEIQVPKIEEESLTDTHIFSLSAEHLFASLHGLLQDNTVEQECFSFEISSDSTGIRFFMTAPRGIIKFVESQLYAQYPKAQLKIIDDYVKTELLEHRFYEVGTFSLRKDYFFPIKVFRNFEIDPLANVMASLSEINESESIWIQYVIKPISDGWQQPGHDYIDMIKTGTQPRSESLFTWFITGLIRELSLVITEIPTALFRPSEPTVRAPAKPAGSEEVRLTTFQELEISSIEEKLARLGFEVVIRVVSTAEDEARVKSNLRSINASFKQFTGTNLNELVLNISDSKEAAIEKYKKRYLDVEEAITLSNEEIATVFHLPSTRAKAPNVSWVYSKQGEPPSMLPTEDVTYIGETIFRGKKVRFGLRNGDDRLRHMYLIGKTGSGKSTLLETMIYQDILNGHGVGVLDPHGETIDHILERIPDERVDDVILFDPSDTEMPIGLNLLEIDDQSQKNLMTSALLSAIKQHFDFSWGPRLEYLLNYALLTLVEVPGTSMLGITRLLEDRNYQNYILHKVQDPIIRRFWEEEFKEMRGNQKLVTEAIAPIQNKVNRFLASTTIRNILGQRNSTFSIWDVMQGRKILLMNLSKGKIGEDNANLLGALLVSRIQFMSLQRARIAPEERVPFYLYVDEFQNFATGSFESVLSESRKYKLGLYLTHQYTSQLPDELLKAVFGNVGTIASFSLGAPDARVLSSEFAPYFDEEDIISLERFHIYIKLMIDGMTSLPFSAKILLPWNEETSVAPKTGNKELVIERSRQRYGRDRAYVEEVIKRWVERPFDKGMAIAEEHKEKQN